MLPDHYNVPPSWANSPYPAMASASTNHLSQISEGHSLSPLHNRKGSQNRDMEGVQPPPMMSKYMAEENSIPYGILSRALDHNDHNQQQQQQQQLLYHKQHSPQFSYGPHAPVEGSDPEGYQGSNTISDAYSADAECRRLSATQEHFGAPPEMFQNLCHSQSEPSFFRQASPSGSDSSFYTGGADSSYVSGAIDPSLVLKSEEDFLPAQDEAAFEPSTYFNQDMNRYPSPEPEDHISLDGHVDVAAAEAPMRFFEDDGLFFRRPTRTGTMISIATTVIPSNTAAENVPSETVPESCSECTPYSKGSKKKASAVGGGGGHPKSSANGRRGKASKQQHRRRNSSMSSGSDSSYSDNNGEYSGKPNPAGVSKKKKTKSTCRECNKKFSNQSELRKHTESSHSKPYHCMFSDCHKPFGARNEWKRHVTSMHLVGEVYRCQELRCEGKPPFNRRDLFAKHVGRMHDQPGCLSKEHADYETSKVAVARIADSCRVRRDGPARCSCGFCGEPFEGAESLNRMLDHVGQHFQAGDECSRREWTTDMDLEAWMVGNSLPGSGNVFALAARHRDVGERIEVNAGEMEC